MQVDLKRERRSRWAVYVLPFLLVANALIWYSALTAPSGEVSVLTAGEGIVLLVRTNDGTVLVGSGSDASILRTLGTTLPPWERHLDTLVLTSPNALTAGGAPDVLARYRVDELVRPAAQGSRTLETALTSAERGTRVVYAHAGDRFTIAPRLFLDVLWPPHTPGVMTPENGALALRLTCGDRSFFIEDGLSPRALEAALAMTRKGDVLISSSTPAQSFSCR